MQRSQRRRRKAPSIDAAWPVRGRDFAAIATVGDVLGREQSDHFWLAMPG